MYQSYALCDPRYVMCKKRQSRPEAAALLPKPVAPQVPYSQLFRFSTPLEKAVLFFGILCSIVNGATMPIFSIFFGRLLDDVNSQSDFISGVTQIAYIFLILGGSAFVVSFGEISLLNISASRQIRRIRTLYFRALLRQDVGWYDLSTAGDLASRLAEYGRVYGVERHVRHAPPQIRAALLRRNTIEMHGGMGQKLGNTVHNTVRYT